MTSKASPQGNGTVAPVVLIVVGCVLFFGALISLIVAGYVIDEQKIDPANSLWPLWVCFLVGPILAAFGAGWRRKRRKN